LSEDCHWEVGSGSSWDVAFARLEQAAERGGLLGQLPIGEWRRLIEGVDFRLE